MSAVVEVLAMEGGGQMVAFECPGCGENHILPVSSASHPSWQFNGDAVRPTLSPSILMRTEKFTAKGERQYLDWIDNVLPCPEKFDMVPVVCHSFVRDGQIEFLSDCTHELRGQTVPLPPIDVHEIDPDKLDAC